MIEQASDLTALSAVLEAVHGRAAGLWRVDPRHLVQLGFVAAPDLDAGVASAFAEATQLVGRDQAEFGIVKAGASASVVVSRASVLPAASGSGRWLRAFGATRSVAVPLFDACHQVRHVLSVALGDEPSDHETAALIRKHAAKWDWSDDNPPRW